MFKLVWRADARRDAQDIVAYIDERNSAAAERMRERFEFVAERLLEFPYMHRVGKVAGTREAVAHANYVMVYKVGLDVIEIVTIYHARQNYP